MTFSVKQNTFIRKKCGRFEMILQNLNTRIWLFAFGHKCHGFLYFLFSIYFSLFFGKIHINLCKFISRFPCCNLWFTHKNILLFSFFWKILRICIAEVCIFIVNINWYQWYIRNVPKIHLYFYLCCFSFNNFKLSFVY